MESNICPTVPWAKEQLTFHAETAEPEVKVLNLTILSPGRPDLVLPIPFQADDKSYAFALKDGSPYSFRFSFIVSNNIVSGLKYTNTVWKTGVRGMDTTNASMHYYYSCINSIWFDLLSLILRWHVFHRNKCFNPIFYFIEITNNELSLSLSKREWMEKILFL